MTKTGKKPALNEKEIIEKQIVTLIKTVRTLDKKTLSRIPQLRAILDEPNGIVLVDYPVHIDYTVDMDPQYFISV